MHGSSSNRSGHGRTFKPGKSTPVMSTRCLLSGSILAVLLSLLAPSAGTALARRQTATVARACPVTDLIATFTVIPFSEGAGQVYYELTIKNVSPFSCRLTGPPGMRLLDANLKPLPTHAVTRPSGRYTIVLPGGQWAQAEAKFSPDVNGPGETGKTCEPVARQFRLTLDGGSLVGAMDPSSVCEHGSMYFTRLRPVAPVPACVPGSFTASFKRNPGGAGYVSYTLTLRNLTASPCHTSGIPSLTLLGANGRKVPQKASTGVNSPYVIAGHARVIAVATFYSNAGPRERKHGACEPSASTAGVNLRPGRLSASIIPPFSACHRGAYTLTGLAGQ